MKFSNSFLDEIRARLPVSTVVSRRVPLRRAGREWKGLSPFNKEKTPSFTVNDQKGFYHCFSSGKHGDIFGFVMETEGLSFPEAVERLAGDAGLPMPKPDPQFERVAKERLGLFDAHEAACAYFETEIATRDGREALDYAERRGLTAATMKEFRIGFAPGSKDALKAALIKRGFSEAQLLDFRSPGQARRRPRALRSLPPPAHNPHHQRQEPHHRLRRPRPRCRDRAEISELAGDQTLRQGLDRVQLRSRPGPRLRQG